MRERASRYDPAESLGYRPPGLFIVDIQQLGNLSAADGLDWFVVPYAGEIVAAQMSLTGTGTNGSTTAEVNVNGVAQFTGTIAAGGTKYANLGKKAVQLKAGDVISLDVTAVPSVGTATDLRVKLLIAVPR
jgi:hypothetical protein